MFPSVIQMLFVRIQTQGTAVNAMRVILEMESFAKKKVSNTLFCARVTFNGKNVTNRQHVHFAITRQ